MKREASLLSELPEWVRPCLEEDDTRRQLREHLSTVLEVEAGRPGSVRLPVQAACLREHEQQRLRLLVARNQVAVFLLELAQARDVLTDGFTLQLVTVRLEAYFRVAPLPSRDYARA